MKKILYTFVLALSLLSSCAHTGSCCCYHRYSEEEFAADLLARVLVLSFHSY